MQEGRLACTFTTLVGENTFMQTTTHVTVTGNRCIKHTCGIIISITPIHADLLHQFLSTARMVKL